MSALTSSSDTVHVYDTRRRVGIRTESERVGTAGKPVAGSPDGTRQRGDTPLTADEHVIELVEGMKPVLVPRYRGRPHLVDPADAFLNVVSPPVNGVNVGKIGEVLEDGNK